MWFRLAAYSITALAVSFCAYGAWFAYLWGFNPLFLLPAYSLVVAVCALLLFVTRKPSRDTEQGQ